MCALPSKRSDWTRAVIYDLEPRVDDGRWPVKRALGDTVEVTAHIIADGHDHLSAELIYQHEDGDERAVPMPLKRYEPTGDHNNEYVASFPVKKLGRYEYRVRAWVDRFETWQDEFQRRVEGDVPDDEISVELKSGADLLREAAGEAAGDDADKLSAHANALDGGDAERALRRDVLRLAGDYDPRPGAVTSDAVPVVVDPEVARFGAWYEFFPRSTRDPKPDDTAEHGTLDDAADRLERIAEMGFNVAYLPPVHPIGETNRKGKDNAPTAEPGEPGSPWAIGGTTQDGSRGGHKAVHPDLGGMAAFERFVERADDLGMKVALDIAFQCSPDHPYVHDHPDWFRQRADGSIRYAENPPKKYEDVHPIDFESDDWKALWKELRNVFAFWIERGVSVFRVDNPHTKPFRFWEWCIESLRAEHPEVVFLAEAFTKPKVMHQLAKLGFNNSYTYFAWRNSKEELTEYGEQLFQTDAVEYFRPNFWPNTPDILTDYLVDGGRAAHKIRFILAATLSSAYGVYGPPFEHVYNKQRDAKEEYADNEKYEVRSWDWRDPNSLQPLMQKVNAIRRENAALQQMRNTRFHETTSEHLIAYEKWTEDNRIVCVVNLDPQHAHDGTLTLPLEDLGLPEDAPYEVEDVLGGVTYTWRGAQNYVRLDPDGLPAHVLRLPEEKVAG
ncbi:MAG: alpha-1,4-glucan--maltose-1-phosphate maltosyltransferase [Bacteroidetes bacterium QS_8_64_10]|nr:MAG: alpha-1,4-glucan--maltose-1-phosphate maltosyltransferase [Bacteroidetes bacterium QS_8_64_10]